MNLCRLFDFLKLRLLHLNLFNTGSQNETTIQNERRSTRFYLIFLITSMVFFIIYYRVIFYTNTTVIEHPSLAEFSKYIKETLLQCPCSNITVKYEVFTEIQPDYHELCYSDFISDKWINHLFSLYEHSWNKSDRIDFRRIAVFQFQTLRSLCQVAQETVSNQLQSFKATHFIQSHLVLPKLFQDQIGSFINEFIKGTPKAFLRTLNFIQDTTAQSLFMTGASITSVRPVTQYRYPIENGFVPYPGINYTFTDESSCVCSSSTATTCMGLATYDNITVSGFQTGCYMLSALMNSTLEALYNQTFIDKVSNSSQSFKKLNSSNSNSKVEMLLSQMLVKSWPNRILYEKYFQSCAPKSCSYRKIQHYSFWNILIILIGLFGGLTKALKIITPILILKIWPMIRKKICKRPARAEQIVVIEDAPGNFY
ncbi:unnamed protein product [Adineta steineri]|uniref:Uncharacterized protein n=1 Tax=Adineta steineri TaxID=433720 RepID=A0A815CMH1_9BILA|nr:unnamed protein product [Adineta steineri]CAF1299060.1 unnamed protein product [Adineta steineri]